MIDRLTDDVAVLSASWTQASLAHEDGAPSELCEAVLEVAVFGDKPKVHCTLQEGQQVFYFLLFF